MIQRRGFLSGVAALLAAPAIIRTPGLLMPVKLLAAPTYRVIPISPELVTYFEIMRREEYGRIYAPVFAPGNGYHPSDRITIT